MNLADATASPTVSMASTDLLVSAPSRPPIISVLMPVYNPPVAYLSEAIKSVQKQTWPDWELVVVDDGSEPYVAALLDELSRLDVRVRVLRKDVNGGIVAATNIGLDASRGTYVAFMDHDDTLEADALAECMAVLASASDIDLLYTDEDRLAADGTSVSPFPKPDWSPERLRTQNYVGHLSVMRRELVVALGGLRAGFDGSQDYDLVLRVSEQARRIAHVPKTLYHWRLTQGSVSMSGQQAVFDAARRAIREHLERTGVVAWVEQTRPEGVYRVHRQVREDPLVSIVIPTRGSRGVVNGQNRIFIVSAVQSIIEKSTYKNVEFVVVADRSMGSAVADRLGDTLGDRLRLIWYDQDFNFSHKINRGAAVARGEFLVLLNDDVEVISRDWIEAMLGLAQQEDVGLVGAMLYFEDDTIQHAGHVYHERGFGHIAYGEGRDLVGPASGLVVERETSGVTAACAMIARQRFWAVGGLCERLPVNFNDVDFSLKVRQAGWRIVWTPHAKLYHYESKSRVPIVLAGEVDTIYRRWERYVERDPYWRFLGHRWLEAPPVTESRSAL